jgi:hypothetical protein
MAITFLLENGCEMIGNYYSYNISQIPFIGDKIGSFNSCITGDGKLINEILNLDDINDLFSMIEDPLLKVQYQLTINDVIEGDHLVPPVNKHMQSIFKSYLSDQRMKVPNTVFDANPFFFLAGTTPSYDLEAAIKAQLSAVAAIREVKFVETECNPAYIKIYSDNSSTTPLTDSCLVMRGPNISSYWKRAGPCSLDICSSNCPISCLDDYFASVDITLNREGVVFDRYIDILNGYMRNKVTKPFWMLS